MSQLRARQRTRNLASEAHACNLGLAIVLIDVHDYACDQIYGAYSNSMDWACAVSVAAGGQLPAIGLAWDTVKTRSRTYASENLCN